MHERSQLWRKFASSLFSEAADRTELSDVALAEALRAELGRGHLSRQTIGAWRRGDQVPQSSVVWATMWLAKTTVPEVLAATLLRHPEMVDLLYVPEDEEGRRRVRASQRLLRTALGVGWVDEPPPAPDAP